MHIYLIIIFFLNLITVFRIFLALSKFFKFSKPHFMKKKYSNICQQPKIIEHLCLYSNMSTTDSTIRVNILKESIYEALMVCTYFWLIDDMVSESITQTGLPAFRRNKMYEYAISKRELMVVFVKAKTIAKIKIKAQKYVVQNVRYT